jgi:hypothetical protein
MVQNNRQLIRLFFLLVIGVGLFGAWFTTQQIQLTNITIATPADNQNWIDLFALIGEQSLQLFLGVTSGQ